MQMYLLSRLPYWSSANVGFHLSHVVVVVAAAAAGYYNPKSTESAPSSSVRIFPSSGHEERFRVRYFGLGKWLLGWLLIFVFGVRLDSSFRVCIRLHPVRIAGKEVFRQVHVRLCNSNILV
jgi:hypothetical protein